MTIKESTDDCLILPQLPLSCSLLIHIFSILDCILSNFGWVCLFRLVLYWSDDKRNIQFSLLLAQPRDLPAQQCKILECDMLTFGKVIMKCKSIYDIQAAYHHPHRSERLCSHFIFLQENTKYNGR